MRALCSIVALALAAPAGHAAPSAPSLQQRVDALAQQIEVRYPSYSPGYASHRESVRAVLATWNASDQSAGDNRDKMAAWLDAALRAVMPGGVGKLPSPPEFSRPLPAPVVVVEPIAPPRESPETVRPVEETPVVVIDRNEEMTEPVELSRTARISAGNPPVAAAPARPREVAKPVVAPTSDEPARSEWSRHPAAAPLEWRDPFTDDRGASPNPLRAGARREAFRPTFRGATTRVDLTQLVAQIRGYNAALRELQARVTRIDEADIFALADAADALERLDQQREFLDLYREGLDADQRRTLPDSPSSELVRELVRRKADTLSQQTPAGRGAERRALERLHDRLANNG